jgi:ketosteroid isomerase-like protein
MTPVPIADRLAIEDLVVAYGHAIDSMGDIDSILAVFTQDAVFDLSGIGLSPLQGHEAIREFYTNVYANTAHMAHYLSNFAVTAYTGHTASIRAYVNGMGLGKDGRGVTVYGRYYFDVIRTAAGWKATRYATDFLMPLSGTLDNAR